MGGVVPNCPIQVSNYRRMRRRVKRRESSSVIPWTKTLFMMARKRKRRRNKTRSLTSLLQDTILTFKQKKLRSGVLTLATTVLEVSGAMRMMRMSFRTRRKKRRKTQKTIRMRNRSKTWMDRVRKRKRRTSLRNQAT